MGIYKKTGIRNIVLKGTDLINWIRIYGFKNGLSTFFGFLFQKKKLFIIRNKKLGNPFFLRNNVSDKAIFKQIFLEEQYKLINSLVNDPKYIIDAGGNIGLAARYFNKVYPEATVISIEPDEINADYLKRNVSEIENIKYLQVALWHRQCNLKIINPKDSPSSFMVNENKDLGNIEAVTINDIMLQFNLPYIDILKIDIEGAEKELFENNPQSWLPKVKCLIIELHDNYKKGAAKAFVKAIQPYEFEMYTSFENVFVVFK